MLSLVQKNKEWATESNINHLLTQRNIKNMVMRGPNLQIVVCHRTNLFYLFINNVIILCVIAQTTKEMNARLDEHPVTYLWTEVFKLHDILVVVRVKLQILLTVHFNLQNYNKIDWFKKGCNFSTFKIFACMQSY